MEKQNPEEFLTSNALIGVKEAALRCQRNPETIRRWIWSGKLPAEKLGNQLFIKTEALANFCREMAVKEYIFDNAETRDKRTEKDSSLVDKIRTVREKIRVRTGRDFTLNEILNPIYQIREERNGEISGLR